MRELTFQEIFDATVSDLVEFSQLYEGKTAKSFYIDIVLSFMQGETDKLDRIYKKLKKETSLEYHDELILITEARLNIRKREIKEKNLIALEKKVPDMNELWRGEAYFILALSFGRAEKHVKAKIMFKKAFKHYRKIDCKKKSLMAFQNYMAAESNVNPEKNMVSDYIFLVQQSRKEGFEDLLANALLSLSREYQLRNGLHIALKYIEEALEVSSVEIGGLMYWLILCQKAELLAELNRKHEAILILEELSAAEFPEIKQNINLLKTKINPNSKVEVKTDDLAHDWAVREKENANRPDVQLGDLEQKLVDFISTGPKEKYDIIEHIYGSSGDLYSLENRFKRLLGRTRKKLPNLIIYKDGNYVISDTIFLQDYKKAT